MRLHGTVDQASEATKAVQVARGVGAVHRVIDDIKVGVQTPKEAASDGAITAKVKAKLAADPSLNPFNVNVSTDDGVVTLMGRVNDLGEKQTAERLARETDGVRGVKNLLEVGDKT